MPVKRRKPKRHKGTVPPEAWTQAFESGFDYFDDLQPLGLVEPHLVWGAGREAAFAEWTAALRAAWAEYGANHMLTRDPDQYPSTPWALSAFGDPAKCR